MLRSSAESAGMASIPRRDWNDVVVTHREYVRAYECILKEYMEPLARGRGGPKLSHHHLESMFTTVPVVAEMCSMLLGSMERLLSTPGDVIPPNEVSDVIAEMVRAPQRAATVWNGSSGVPTKWFCFDTGLEHDVPRGTGSVCFDVDQGARLCEDIRGEKRLVLAVFEIGSCAKRLKEREKMRSAVSTVVRFYELTKDKQCTAGKQFSHLAHPGTDEASRTAPETNTLRFLMTLPISHAVKLVPLLVRLIMGFPGSTVEHGSCTFVSVCAEPDNAWVGAMAKMKNEIDLSLSPPSTPSNTLAVFKNISDIVELYWYSRYEFQSGMHRVKLQSLSSSLGAGTLLSDTAPFREILKKGSVLHVHVKAKKSGLLRRSRRENTEVPAWNLFKPVTAILLSDSMALLHLTDCEYALRGFFEYSESPLVIFRHEFVGQGHAVAKIVGTKKDVHYFMEDPEGGKGFFRSLTRLMEKHSKRVFGRKLDELVPAEENVQLRRLSFSIPSPSSDMDGAVDDTKRSRSLSNLERVASGTNQGLATSTLEGMASFSAKWTADGTSTLHFPGSPKVVEHMLYALVNCASIGVVEDLYTGAVDLEEWNQLRSRLDSLTPEVKNIRRRSPYTVLFVLSEYLRLLPVPLLHAPEKDVLAGKKLRRNNASESEKKQMKLAQLAALASGSSSYGFTLLEVIVYWCLQMMTASQLPREVTKRILGIYLAGALIRPPVPRPEMLCSGGPHSLDWFLFLIDNAGDFFALCEKRKLMRSSITHGSAFPSDVMEILNDDENNRWWKAVLLEEEALMSHIACPDLIRQLLEIAFPPTPSPANIAEVMKFSERALTVLSRRLVSSQICRSAPLMEAIYQTAFGVPIARHAEAHIPTDFVLSPLCQLLNVLVKSNARALSNYFLNEPDHAWPRTLARLSHSANVTRFILSIATHQRVAKHAELAKTVDLFATKCLEFAVSTIAGNAPRGDVDARTHAETSEPSCITEGECSVSECIALVSTLIQSSGTWCTLADGAELSLRVVAQPEMMGVFLKMALGASGNEMGVAACELIRVSIGRYEEARPLVVSLMWSESNVALILEYVEQIRTGAQRPTDYTVRLFSLLRDSLQMYFGSASEGLDRSGLVSPERMGDVVLAICCVLFALPRCSILHAQIAPLYEHCAIAIAEGTLRDDDASCLIDALGCDGNLGRVMEVLHSGDGEAMLRSTCWRIIQSLARNGKAAKAVSACMSKGTSKALKQLCGESKTMLVEAARPTTTKQRPWWVFQLDTMV